MDTAIYDLFHIKKNKHMYFQNVQLLATVSRAREHKKI